MNYKNELEKINKINNKEQREKAKKAFNHRVKQKTDRWVNLKKELESIHKERVKFVTQYVFYPRHYANDITTFEVYLDRINDFIEENPLRDDQDIVDLINKEKNKVKEFKKVKKSVDEILPKLEKYEKNINGKEEEVRYFSQKQDLFLHLQRGNIKEVRDLLKSFRSELKRNH